MNTVHKVLFAAVALAMIFVGDVSAMKEKDKVAGKGLGFGQKAMMQGVEDLQNPAAIAGGVFLISLASEGATGKNYGLKEAAAVGEGYALIGGEVNGTVAAMTTDLALHHATNYAKDNPTAQKFAKAVKADTSYGQYFWRTLASFTVGYAVDNRDTK
jgi:hypothetical protein